MSIDESAKAGVNGCNVVRFSGERVMAPVNSSLHPTRQASSVKKTHLLWDRITVLALVISFWSLVGFYLFATLHL
jgi:hypothetical protein